jgi:hypothetical protein
VSTYFADSSALAKRYVVEVGTAWLRALLDPTTGNVVVIARITAVELTAAFTRRERADRSPLTTQARRVWQSSRA